jgi:ABC-type branched-subunit amino acid transport system permease subunit
LSSDREGSKATPGSPASFVEVHEEFIQHIEAGQRKIRSLSLLTLLVSVLLGASYLVQLVYPYVGGESVVSVNLRDPTLVATEVLVTVLAFAWVYVGATNYLFASRLGRMVKSAREAEKKLAAEAGLNG